MIEIDARIRKIDFTFLGSHIVFDDQVLFYRSKSILQVVSLLLQSARVDSKLVGFLVLAFSVILPVSKLLSTLVYMYANARWRANSLLQWFAFKSGKWSMADVIIVAIFMAYVGFDGILDDQLKQVERNNQMLTSIATNLTSLEAGFILFLSFVLFSLILSEILKRSVKKSLKTKD
ncbi:MAG: paraquat-inducible protein A [Owenweeksia sp.]|nr:paraquat-inducible protein A [Owenweeksia sp.]